MTRTVTIIGLVLSICLATARAQPAAVGDSIAGQLRQANGALQRGEYQRAADLAQAVTRRPGMVEPADRTEAWRVLGLALFFLDRHQESEAALLEYLKRDVDAHLDPALVPPEAIVFFEDVRSRHAAELRQYRPVPRTTARTFLKNFLPPWGQIQNGQAGKAWVLGLAETLLLGTHLTTYFVYRSWCDPVDDTCDDGADHTVAARKVRVANLVSGALLIGVYAYGVIDGLVEYRRQRRRVPVQARTLSVGVVPTTDGAYLSVFGRF